MCFGKFFPKLSENYPNNFVDLVFHSAKPSTINLTENLNNSIKLHSVFYVDFHINPWTNNTNVLARLGNFF